MERGSPGRCTAGQPQTSTSALAQPTVSDWCDGSSRSHPPAGRTSVDVTAHDQVGSYRLDFAVRHAQRPGRFVLAVEADGAAHHSGVFARERDRLRQQSLEARARRWCASGRPTTCATPTARSPAS
ncbi:hypothetical protein [Cellulomonas sp. URHB0016]